MINDKNYILNIEQCNFLFKTSFFSLTSFIFAIYKERYLLSIVPGGVFLTSINYWRKPEINCVRRYIDIGWVQFAFFYQLYITRNAENRNQYYVIIFFCILSFLISVYLSNKWDILNIIDKKEKYYKMWLVTYLHSFVHIFANLANIILYSGYIYP